MWSGKSNEMTILLVNDDGYTRDGIRALDRAFTQAGHEVWVVSPSSNRSAQSHAMCLSGPIRMTRYGTGRYHCSGSPTDCILYSIKGGMFPHLPDLVVSGINHGYNCSQGVKAIAVSAGPDADGRYEFDRVASFVCDNLDALVSLLDDECFLNLNFPPHFKEKVEAASLGRLYYGDVPQRSDEGEDGFTLQLVEGETKRTLASAGERTDIEVCDDGFIALSVVKVNPAVDEAGGRTSVLAAAFVAMTRCASTGGHTCSSWTARAPSWTTTGDAPSTRRGSPGAHHAGR